MRQTSDPGALGGVRTQTQASGLHAVPALLVLAFFVPVQLFVGDLRLPFYRIVLILAFVPTLLRLVSAEGLRWRAPDTLFVLAASCGGFALIVTGSSIQTVGIFVLEMVGPYLVARAYIRDAAGFAGMVRLFSGALIATLPFAVYESLTGDPILLDLLDKAFTVLPNVPHEMRFGLDRAQLTFDHPILYGVFASMAFAPAFYAARVGKDGRTSWLRPGLTAGAVFFSLSSGAWVSVAAQIALIGYDRILGFWRKRWRVFFWVGAALAVAVEALSNRTLPEIMINYVALNAGTAWTRIMVNEWAWGAVMAHPLFGLGYNWSWPVHWWLPTTSIDNFWIALAFRQGLPLMVFLLASVAWLVFLLARARCDDPADHACRMGLVIAIVATCMAVYTVHIWNSTFCMFLFMLGCGGWLIDRKPAPADAPQPQTAPQTEAAPAPLPAAALAQPRFSRFDGQPPVPAPAPRPPRLTREDPASYPAGGHRRPMEESDRPHASRSHR